MGVNTQRKKGEKTPKGAAGNTETVSKQMDDLIEGYIHKLAQFLREN